MDGIHLREAIFMFVALEDSSLLRLFVNLDICQHANRFGLSSLQKALVSMSTRLRQLLKQKNFTDVENSKSYSMYSHQKAQTFTSIQYSDVIILVGAFQLSLSELRSDLDSVYDVTISYKSAL
jgi:hypothetical protein